ncbi:MAG: hypothetical protein OHK0013_39510 [Sandaracinaceae bacterium]
MLLSGFVFPIDNMPLPLRLIVRAILVRGVTLADIYPQLGALAPCGLVLATVATLRFRKTAG